MPANRLVRSHNEGRGSPITERTSNSPTTLRTGTVAYTITISTGREKMFFRNSNLFSPLKMAEANRGLIDNKARVGFREFENNVEFLTRNPFESSRGRFNVAYYAILDQRGHIGSVRERVRIQEVNNERGIVPAISPLLSQLFVREDASLAAKPNKLLFTLNLTVVNVSNVVGL